MKIIEQGHCGGSEQKEGKWPWRHNIGKTTELTKCAHVSAKNRHAHIPSERQLWETVTEVSVTPKAQRLAVRGFCPKVHPEQCLSCDMEEKGVMPGEYLINGLETCGQDLETLLSRPKFVINVGQMNTSSPLIQGEKNIGFLPVTAWLTRRTKQNSARRGLEMLSKRPFYHHCPPCAGTRQTQTSYQCRKEIIHNVVLGGRMEE